MTGSPKTLGLQRGRMSKQCPAANRTEKDKLVCRREERGIKTELPTWLKTCVWSLAAFWTSVGAPFYSTQSKIQSIKHNLEDEVKGNWTGPRYQKPVWLPFTSSSRLWWPGLQKTRSRGRAELQLSVHGVKASTWRTEAVIGPVKWWNIAGQWRSTFLHVFFRKTKTNP